MAIADPKDYAKKAAEPSGLSVSDLIEALRALKGEDDDTLKRRAQYEAEAHARLNKRENETHPGISVYSHPEGDRAHPKDPLKCEMFWVGYPLEVDNLTPDEVALLNRATIGEFTFQRTDGASEKLSITGQTDALGNMRRLEFHFPCRGENRNNLPSKAALLRQAFGLKTVEQAELDKLRAELAKVPASAR